MDLETENRIAAVLLREASELRRQAQEEGVLAYLRKPTVRGRPNSRFLTATVRGIQQVNRAVEMDEMWRVRQKELELDNKVKGRSRDDIGSSRDYHSDSGRSRDYRSDNGKGGNKELSESQIRWHNSNTSCSSSKRSYEDHSREEEGLRDEEIEEFLHSRVKRGRGSIGSRMDETGPYLPHDSEEGVTTDRVKDERHSKAVVGPEKPSSWKRCESSDESSDDDDDDDDRKRSLKTSSGRSKKKHSKKHKSKEKSWDKKKYKSSKH